MAVEIITIPQDHIEGFHRALDFVARERRYLAFLEAPPPESTRDFVLNNIAQGYPQWVVLSAGELVGWCDIIPKSRPVHARVGVLGVALLPEFRGQGIGETPDAADAGGGAGVRAAPGRADGAGRQRQRDSALQEGRVRDRRPDARRHQGRWRPQKCGSDGYIALAAGSRVGTVPQAIPGETLLRPAAKYASIPS